MGGSNSTMIKEVEEFVMKGDFHLALQTIGRPAFAPGDGSLMEWIFTVMYETHIDFLATLQQGQPRTFEMDLQTFLRLVATGPSSRMTTHDHERHWQCYAELCQHYDQMQSSLAYHATWVSVSPADICQSMANRSDLKGLAIMCRYFDMAELTVCDHLPCTVMPREYMNLIRWEDDSIIVQLEQHIEQRFQWTGNFDQALEAIQFATLNLSECKRLKEMQRHYEELRDTLAQQEEQPWQPHSKTTTMMDIQSPQTIRTEESSETEFSDTAHNDLTEEEESANNSVTQSSVAHSDIDMEGITNGERCSNPDDIHQSSVTDSLVVHNDMDGTVNREQRTSDLLDDFQEPSETEEECHSGLDDLHQSGVTDESAVPHNDMGETETTSSKQCHGLQDLQQSIGGFLEKYSQLDNSLSMDRAEVVKFLQDLQNKMHNVLESNEGSSTRASLEMEEIHSFAKKEDDNGSSESLHPLVASSELERLSNLVKTQDGILREKDEALQTLQDKYDSLQHHHALEQIAQRTRIEYLEELLHRGDVHSHDPDRFHQRQSPRRNNDSSGDIRRLAVALECSERRRAEALDALHKERRLFADKMRKLSTAVQHFNATMPCRK